MNLQAVSLVIFIVAQGLGIGIIASGDLTGLIPMAVSLPSGYIGIEGLLK